MVYLNLLFFSSKCVCICIYISVRIRVCIGFVESDLIWESIFILVFIVWKIGVVILRRMKEFLGDM